MLICTIALMFGGAVICVFGFVLSCVRRCALARGRVACGLWSSNPAGEKVEGMIGSIEGGGLGHGAPFMAASGPPSAVPGSPGHPVLSLCVEGVVPHCQVDAGAGAAKEGGVAPVRSFEEGFEPPLVIGQ